MNKCIVKKTKTIRCEAMDKLRPMVWDWVANHATYCPCCGVKLNPTVMIRR